MFDTLRADFGRYYDLLPAKWGLWKRFVFFFSCQGMWAILDLRQRKWLVKQPYIVQLLLGIPVFFWHILVETSTGISIETGCKIGKGLYIGHFTGIFVHEDVVMGERCSLSQGVSVGLGGSGATRGSPHVGDRVYFGAGSKVLGKITIGSGVRVGANAVVLDSVPDGATAVGVPARIITKGGESQAPSKDSP